MSPFWNQVRRSQHDQSNTRPEDLGPVAPVDFSAAALSGTRDPQSVPVASNTGLEGAASDAMFAPAPPAESCAPAGSFTPTLDGNAGSGDVDAQVGWHRDAEDEFDQECSASAVERDVTSRGDLPPSEPLSTKSPGNAMPFGVCHGAPITGHFGALENRPFLGAVIRLVAFSIALLKESYDGESPHDGHDRYDSDSPQSRSFAA